MPERRRRKEGRREGRRREGSSERSWTEDEVLSLSHKTPGKQVLMEIWI